MEKRSVRLGIMDKKLGLYIQKSYSKGIQSIIIKEEAIVIWVEKNGLINLLNYLKTSSALRFGLLLDIWGVDYPMRKDRFEVGYLLLSIKLNKRIIIKVRVSEDDMLESAVGVFSSAGWLEREVWDMYGVFFGNNPDLRRILTDYGFEGHPLRKDYPLSGFVEVRYDDGEKRVVMEPIEVQQEYRLYNFASPWVLNDRNESKK